LSSTEPITTAIEHRDGVAVLSVGGDIDLATAPAFEAAIAAALQRTPAALVIELSRVDFLASAGLQILVATHERVSKSSRFAVVANGPATSRPIELTGLDDIFALYPTLDDALKALQAG
jgi:anti-sigma B factor antagonist